MSVRDEINRFADDSHKDALNWLLSKYHMQSQWSFVARCTHKSYGNYSYQTNRVWTPTDEGWVLYKNSLTTTSA